MYALSRREMKDAERSISASSRSLSRGGGRGAAIEGAIDMAETSAGLFGWGLVHGRFGVYAPMGISLDLLVGVALGGLALFVPGLGGKYVSQLTMNLGTASLGSFMMRKGVQTGTSMRTAANLPALSASDLGTGIFGGDFARGAVTSGGHARDLSDAELAAMAAASRAR